MLQYLSNKIRISDIHLKVEFSGYDENDKKVTKKFEFKEVKDV